MLIGLMATACVMLVIVPKYGHATVVLGTAMLGAKAASTNKDEESEELWNNMHCVSKPWTATRPGNDEERRNYLRSSIRSS
jgi:ribulose kinase